MKTLKIINPAAGKGMAICQLEGGEYYKTAGIGDAERFVKEKCLTDPETHFVVCGGDGTISEVVNGIVKSGSGDTASVSIIPLGTGNDLKRYCGGKEVSYRADVIKYNDNYCINEINIGFDCNVVKHVNKMTKGGLITGSTAYIFGVAKAFFRRMYRKMKITVTKENGETEVFEGDYTLCLAANGRYYGGGFCPAPNADITDGYFDAILVKKMSRLKFLQLIAVYKKGKHIGEDGQVIKKFKNYISYYKSTAMKVENIDCLCCDGEVYDLTEVDIKIVPSSVNITI